jgi:hypothetical protein
MPANGRWDLTGRLKGSAGYRRLSTRNTIASHNIFYLDSMAPCWNISSVLCAVQSRGYKPSINRLQMAVRALTLYYITAIICQLSSATALLFTGSTVKTLGYKPTADCRYSEFRYFVTGSYESGRRVACFPSPAVARWLSARSRCVFIQWPSLLPFSAEWDFFNSLVCFTCTGPCIVMYCYSTTNEMHQFLKFILFCSSTVHVSEGLSVHHQESKTVHTASGIRGWSETFSASNIDGNTIGKFFPKLVICHNHPCEIASHSIK